MKEEDIKDNILNTFKLPIEYTDFKNLNKNVITDLELDLSKNAYSILFSNNTKLGNIIQTKWKHYYSSDVSFLKAQQNFIKSIRDKKTNVQQIRQIIHEINDYYVKWRNLKTQSQDDFLKKYQFVEWDHVKFLNNHPLFLQAMTYYNVASPLIHILLPIVLLVIPFFLIKLVMRIPFTFSMYKNILSKTFQNHAFGKMFNAFCAPNCNTLDMNTKIYAAVSFALYIFTLYQNILGCIKFYKNTCFIQEFMYDTKKFIKNCNTLREFTNNHYTKAVNNNNETNNKPYTSFIQENDNQIMLLNEFDETIHNISSTFFSVKNITNVGNMMYAFHEIFTSHEIQNTFSYWFGCAGFLENIFGVIENVNQKNINFTKLTNKNVTMKMTNLHYIYYLNHENSNENSKNSNDCTADLSSNKIIKNTITLDKNIIISGPNASGKTTILKSTLLNTLFSQQLGVGCFDTFILQPFDYIDSYINIPDTSQRDSLFQAEARRCLNIINHIQENPNSRVFCIFDELFSGTNPYEAQKSAISYLNYLHKFNVSYILTTHFEKLKALRNSKCKQLSMRVDMNKTNMEYNYTYLLRKGVSNIYGGFKVLRDLRFPKEITEVLQ